MARDTWLFLALLLPVLLLGRLPLETPVRVLLLIPVVVLQALFIWRGLRDRR